MELDTIQKVYRRYGRYYDLYFGPILNPGRQEVLDIMAPAAGEHVLEVGVGTGLSLPLYPQGTHITGVDVSPEMIECALDRVARQRLEGIDLRVLDAGRMPFADGSFDKVTAMYVVSVAPDPAALVAEMQRVCRPGGEIFIVNHFQHRRGVVGTIERMLSPLARLIGFHADFCMDRFISETRLNVLETRPVNAFGIWTMLRVKPDPACQYAPEGDPENARAEDEAVLAGSY